MPTTDKIRRYRVRQDDHGQICRAVGFSDGGLSLHFHAETEFGGSPEEVVIQIPKDLVGQVRDALANKAVASTVS